MKALALDPGRTTGYCHASYVPNKLATLYVGEEQYSLGEIFNVLERFVEGGLVTEKDDCHIIYEDFHYRNLSRTGVDLTPVKMIGIIELFRERYEPFVSFTLQSPAAGKAFWTDAKLKERGIYKVGAAHGRDATRHFMQWAAFGPGSAHIDIDSVQLALHVG